MPHRVLIVALSMIAAVTPALASDREPASRTAPPGTSETRYCLRVEPVIGSLIQTIQCWTRQEWAAKEVDVDREWAREGVRVIS